MAIALCLALVASGCGGDDDATSAQQDTSATTAQPQDSDDELQGKVVIGDYEEKGPFFAIHGGKGNELPRFDPPDQPAPKQLLTRDLEVGTGPAAQRGDWVDVYYAGAEYTVSKPQYYSWPPSQPLSVKLGDSGFEDAWEESIEGMKVGGVRQVIIPSRLLEGSTPPPLNYVIELADLGGSSERPQSK